MKNNNYAVIMAGGVGSRFWPVSKENNPKQFQDILGVGKSLLQTTFERLEKCIPAENIYILTNDNYKNIVLDQLPEISEEQLVLEPVMRNTAPCILLAAMKIYKKNAYAKMLVAPSDHWIQQEDAFVKDIEFALEIAEKENKLVTFGIKPSFPNTGYGYINYDNRLKNRIFPVLKFMEKPDFTTAQKFIKDGNYLWNSGIFVWKVSDILNNFEEFLPEMYSIFEKGDYLLNTAAEVFFLAENYYKLQNISIDYGIIEKSTDVYVIPASFSWNDLGTWGSIPQELKQDEHHNTVVNSRYIPLEAKGNIIRTQSDKVVVVDGLENYMILEHEEVLLIIPKRKEQEIKDIRLEVMRRYSLDLG